MEDKQYAGRQRKEDKEERQEVERHDETEMDNLRALVHQLQEESQSLKNKADHAAKVLDRSKKSEEWWKDAYQKIHGDWIIKHGELVKTQRALE